MCKTKGKAGVVTLTSEGFALLFSIMILRIIKIALALLFVLFAYFQLNDEDASLYVNASQWEKWSWVCFYGLIAAMFLWSRSRRVSSILLGVAAVFAIYHMVVTAPGIYENFTKNEVPVITSEQMSPEKPEVELSREFFGAMIGLAAVVFLFVVQCFTTRKTNLLE